MGSSAARYLNGPFIPGGTLYTNYHAVEHPSLPNYLDMTSGKNSGCRSNSCPRRSYPTNNIFSQLTAEAIRWRAWYSLLSRRLCRSAVVPYPRPQPEQLKPFIFVTPNTCSDMHDCSVAHGDRWLRDHVPGLLSAGAVVIIRLDEGTTAAGGGGRVMTAISGPGVTEGVRNQRAYDHLGLLGGIEQWFGVRRLHGAKTHR